MERYILVGHDTKPVEDLMEWAKAFEGTDRHVASDELPGGIRVSTVFLGIDHGFRPIDGDRPILFETMIFGGDHDQYQERYSTWGEAEAGHARAVAKCFEA